MLSTCRYVVDGVERVGGHALRIGTPKGFNHCYYTWRDGLEGRQPDYKSCLYTSTALTGGKIILT
ncbi:hypothetical protein MYX88_004770 [Salmonella enterica]|nr:hypothetical protein [Salmonella enterica]